MLKLVPLTENSPFRFQAVDVNLVAETDNFVWKSHSKLDMQNEAVKFEAGMQVSFIEDVFSYSLITLLLYFAKCYFYNLRCRFIISIML